MSVLPEIDTQFLLDFLAKLLNTPSPTGLAEPAVAFTEQTLKAFKPLKLGRTRKGALLASWAGERDDGPRALTAHVDTLGAMVKEVKSNGRLKLSRIGGFAWNTIEGEGVTVFTSKGRTVRGSVLLTKASSHVFGAEVNEMKRDDENMEVRLDARTFSQKETVELGIQVGDFVSFDPRVEVTGGFVRSRHLDDKACVACLAAAAKALYDGKKKPTHPTHFLISNYEEVGHGAAAGLPADVEELLVVDMAAVGEGQASDEFHASLCVKDSGGPYHHGLSTRLRGLAEKNAIPYKVDIYPHYGSDGEAWWSAGADAAVALIGPGVDASHSYERTHTEALVATTRWVLAYLLED
ncbi:MAG TPA: M42 family metallopeptidase [Anaerolineales bacterium]|nr:M42 family metallopeptidase [Anaerolineales bacterium]